MKKTQFKRIISLILVIAMCVTFQPVMPVMAGGDFLEVVTFDNNRPDEYNQGTTSSVTSYAMTITYEAARRTQRSRLYYTSSPTSSVKESFTAVITKP